MFKIIKTLSSSIQKSFQGSLKNTVLTLIGLIISPTFGCQKYQVWLYAILVNVLIKLLANSVKYKITIHQKSCADQEILYDWFAHTVPDTVPTRTRFWQLVCLFSSPETKAQVSHCRPFSSVVRRPSSVNFLHFSSSSWKRMVGF